MGDNGVLDVWQVLHMDRNDYYGGAAASLNLNQVSDCVALIALFSRCFGHVWDVIETVWCFVRILTMSSIERSVGERWSCLML